MRAWLAELFSELAYRLNDGHDPLPDDLNQGPPGSTPVMPPPISPDFRFDAWKAQVQQKSMRLGPWIAVAASIVLVIGLVKFWQIAASRPGNPTAANGAQDVAQKFEDAYRINQVKSELRGIDTNTAPALSMSAFPIVPLIYFFPRDARTYYMPPAYPTRQTSRPPAKRVTVVYDPLADIMRGYSPEIEAADQQQSSPKSNEDVPANGGPIFVGHMGR